MTYDIARFLHITGVVMLMGNITVTAIWKFFADDDGRPQVLGFAQKLVTYTDWSMTVWGAGLTMLGGYGMVVIGGWDLVGTRWLLWGQVGFVAAGLTGSASSSPSSGGRHGWRGVLATAAMSPPSITPCLGVGWRGGWYRPSHSSRRHG